MTTENITNNTNVTNINNSQSQTAKPEAVTNPQPQAANPEVAKPQAAAAKPAAAPAPAVKAKKSLWKRVFQRLCPTTGLEAMILLIIVVLFLLVLNDWNISSRLNDTIKVVNDISAELAKLWYQFW